LTTTYPLGSYARSKQLVNQKEHELIALRDKFPVDAADTDWVPVAGKLGWIVISRDHNQRRRNAEHRSLRQHKIKALYIRQSGNPDQSYADAARIIKNWPKIRDWGVAAKPRTHAKFDTSDRIVEP
jgi:hypothetical protein